jgi:hypothetical protein
MIGLAFLALLFGAGGASVWHPTSPAPTAVTASVEVGSIQSVGAVRRTVPAAASITDITAPAAPIQAPALRPATGPIAASDVRVPAGDARSAAQTRAPPARSA